MTTFNEGDKVRYRSGLLGYAHWEGLEATVIGDSAEDLTKVKVTKDSPNSGMNRQGRDCALLTANLELVSSAREVGIPEVQVGDTIRVVYPEHVRELGTVTETVNRVREGKVAEIRGREFDDAKGYLINAYLEGWGEAVYELLHRPEKVRTAADAKVGEQFMARDPFDGKHRLFTKVGENKWSDVFFESGNVYSISDVGAQNALDTRNGQWLKVGS